MLDFSTVHWSITEVLCLATIVGAFLAFMSTLMSVTIYVRRGDRPVAQVTPAVRPASDTAHTVQ